MNKSPVWFTIIRHEQIASSGVFAQRLLISIPCTLNDLDTLYSEYRQFLIETPGIQVALFTRDPEQTPISEHMARSLYSTLAPIPAPLAITEDSKGRLIVHLEHEKVVDDPPFYSDWDELNPR